MSSDATQDNGTQGKAQFSAHGQSTKLWQSHGRPCPYCHQMTVVKAWQPLTATQGLMMVHCLNEACTHYYMTKSERSFFEVQS